MDLEKWVKKPKKKQKKQKQPSIFFDVIKTTCYTNKNQKNYEIHIVTYTNYTYQRKKYNFNEFYVFCVIFFITTFVGQS